jgi:quinol monooxygenase YgiN
VARFGLCGKLVATAGNGDVLEGYLLEAASALEDVDGCHLYAVSRDPAEDEAIWVVEFWESAEAHQASLELSAVQQLISQARPVLAAMGDRFEFQPVGGKGLPPPPSI